MIFAQITWTIFSYILKLKKKHVTHVFKVLERLQKIDLYLDIKKCEFFVIEIKYLSLIITTKKVKMNSIKINAIVNWSTSRNLKNVQTFLNFVNFYRKFIFNYSKIAKSLIKFTKMKKKKFKYSWNLKKIEQKVFETLKKIFTTIFILQHFDFDKKTWIKIDVSNYVMTNILF